MFGDILAGKVAVVTGGAIGIGEASTRLFHAARARCAIVDNSRERGARLEAELGGETIFIETDVADEDQVAAMTERVISRFGRFDILVNSAGITSLNGPVLVENVPKAEWDRMMMSINLTGAFLTTKHAVREMKRNRYGRIVNISSTAAAGGGYRGASPSSASKAGLVGLTKMVAFECGLDGITCNAIGPGPTKTPTQTILMVKEQEIAATLPVDFLADAEDIANAVCFLASDAARFITGQLICPLNLLV
jgi:3-oxoacyl-[acyl-carrier protein] reductase